MNDTAVLWPRPAQLNASFVTAPVPLEIIFMHWRRMPFIFAGERSDRLS